MTKSDETPSLGQVEDRLRRDLAAMAERAEAPDRWDEVAERIAGGTVVSLASPSSARSTVGRLARPILVAAAVIAVVAAATLVLANRTDDEADVTTDPSPGTGWMVPAEIPAGWELLSVDTDFMDVEDGCPAPCFLRTWSAQDGGAALTIVEGELAEKIRPASARDVDLGPVSALLGDERIFWRDGVTTVLVLGHGIGEDELIQVARSWAGARSNTAPADVEPDLPDEFQAQPVLAADIPARARSFQAVLVRFRHVESGRTLAYQLSPRGLGLYVAPAVLDFSFERVGNLTLTRTEGVTTDGVEPEVPYYELQGPNSDVVAGGSPDDGMLDEGVTRGEVESFLRSLEEVDAATWREFTRRAAEPVDPETQKEIDAPSIDDPSIYRFEG